MKRNEAIEYISDHGRLIVSPEFAKELCEAIGVPFSDELVYTAERRREDVKNKELPRVSIGDLAEYISIAFKVLPDEEELTKACSMSGEGSYQDLRAHAYMKNIK